jgi:hypothetical protein
VIELDLRDLSAFSSSTRAVLTACSEAAAVMLWKFHKAPRSPGSWHHTEASAQHDDPVDIALLWDVPGREVLASHGNEKDATEDGAYAIAIALADRLGFRVIGRTHQGSGTDWLMIRKGEPANDYYKLEVSGLARINKEKPVDRLQKKVTQGSGGDMQRPGVAVVVRFEDIQILSEAWT